jgi:hypothetical protein
VVASCEHGNGSSGSILGRERISVSFQEGLLPLCEFGSPTSSTFSFMCRGSNLALHRGLSSVGVECENPVIEPGTHKSRIKCDRSVSGRRERGAAGYIKCQRFLQTPVSDYKQRRL